MMTEQVQKLSVFVGPGISGNRLVVVTLNDLGDDQKLIDIATQYPGIDVAFLANHENKAKVRWFNGRYEIQFCGHGALGVAYVLGNEVRTSAASVKVYYPNGVFHAFYQYGKYWISINTLPPEPVALDAIVPVSQLGMAVKQVYYEPTMKVLLVECQQLEELQGWGADYDLLASWSSKLIGALMLFSESDGEYDVNLRYFAPWYGKNEDTATGSALRYLMPLLCADKQNKSILNIRQYSVEGGLLMVQPNSNNQFAFSGDIECL